LLIVRSVRKNSANWWDVYQMAHYFVCPQPWLDQKKQELKLNLTLFFWSFRTDSTWDFIWSDPNSNHLIKRATRKNPNKE
jgi:hypothetical protein